MKPNMQMKRDELVSLAEDKGHKVSDKMKKAEILALLAIRPEAVETVVETVVAAPAEAQWCMYCGYYAKAPKGRPYMICRVRGGIREPNAGETCIHFKRK